MQRETNILFLGGAKRVSLAERFIRGGVNHDINVKIFSYELDCDVPISAVGKVIIGKRWRDPSILEHLADTCETHKINIVIPFLDQATIIASKFKKTSADIFIPVSGEKVCEIFFNKIQSDDWFRKNGFPVPSSELKPPMIAKPHIGSASKGLIILRQLDELKAFVESEHRTNYLLQAYISGAEYSVDCFVSQKGQILAVIPRIRLDVVGGEVTKTRTVREDNIIRLSEEIISKSGLIGPVTIQFIRDQSTGIDLVMEVNPRFGGGVIAAIEAGANIPEMILKEHLGIPNTPVPNWKENMLMMRAHREFF